MTAPEGTGHKPPLFDRSAIRMFLGYYRSRVARLLAFTAGASLQSLLVLPVLVLIKFAFDRAIPAGDVAALVRIGVTIILIRVAGTLLSLAMRSHVLHTIKGAVTELRRDLVSRLYRLSHGYFASADLAVLHTRIVQDSERVDHLSNTIFSGVVPALVASLVLFVVLIVLSWKLVLVGAVILPLIWLSSRASGWLVRRDVFKFQRAFEGFSKGVNFAVRQLDLTRVKAFEDEELERQGQHIGELYASGHRMAMSYAVHSHVQRTLTGIAAILILVIGGAAVARGRMTLGEFLTFYVAAGMFYGYVDSLTSSIPELLSGNASLVTLYRFMTDGEPEPYLGTRRIEFDGSVEMRGVTFGYNDAPVLRRVDLAIPSGAQVAIVGPNGAGKSTLVHLLLGFYRPNHGRVLASGVPLDEIDLRSLRRSIGVVPQRPQFFSGTVRDNISYGSPDATQDEVDAAARLSLADEVVARLPDGYETMIGDHGVRLSGGEAQRLAIARALLGRPRLLILDEPTNHLDVPAVGRLMSGLAGRDDRPTLIVISHDRSVVEFAATVYRLENGSLHAEPQALVNAAV
ncbi:MAG TPA: ABC transporter ATP-binding protein [Gemmatimonadaceae bacterium]